MSRRSFILLPDNNAWRVARVQDSVVTFRDVPAARAPADVSGILASMDYAGEGVLLALPSSWCFAANVDTGGLSRRDAKALLYRLEESLPLAAEEVTADFIVPGDGTRALGVAVRLSLITPLVTALEASGVAVQSIVPAAILAAQFAASEAGDERLLVAYHDGDSDLIEVRAGELRAWIQSCGGEDPSKLGIELMSIEADAPPRVMDFKRCPDSRGDALTDATSGVVAACRCGAEILQARRKPPIELRAGPLAATDPFRRHRGPVNALLAAAVVLFLVVAGSLMIRAQRYNRLAEEATKDLADRFHSQFPDRPVPEHVSAILASERRKLEAASPVRGNAGTPASALRTLQGVVSHLPANAPFELDHMSFEGAAFELTGRIGSYEQVDTLAASTRAAGFTVSAPEARRAADGFWSFTLRGETPRAVAQNGGGHP